MDTFLENFDEFKYFLYNLDAKNQIERGIIDLIINKFESLELNKV